MCTRLMPSRKMIYYNVAVTIQLTAMEQLCYRKQLNLAVFHNRK